jgi:hypothetical protein
VRSVFRDEKKLSIAALSQTLPDRLIEQVTPLSAISRWNWSDVYWLPSVSPWCIPPTIHGRMTSATGQR